MTDNTRAHRPSFRRILTTRLGITLAVSLAALAVLAWIAGIAWTNYQLLVPLRAEAAHVTSILGEGSIRETDRYDWSEPHHRFAEHRIDPFFLQVFDRDGRLVRSSENVAALDAPYPARLLASIPQKPSAWRSQPVRFSVGSDRLYALIEPIIAADGSLLGATQVARFDLGHEKAIRRLGGFIAAAYVVVLSILMGLLTVSSRRVVKPLEALTQQTRLLSLHELDQGVVVPSGADDETGQLAAAINTALERIDVSYQKMQRFTADAAHELQTPLTVLNGHIEVALRHSRSPEQYRAVLETLHDEVGVMTRLVRGLLRLARLESARHSAAGDRVNVGQLVRDAVAAIEPVADDTAQRIRVDIPDGLFVPGDEALLRDVFLNLLDNARKYSGGGPVEVAARVDDGAVTVAVTDNGRGVDEADIPRLTERFFRARDVQSIAGHGLGLAIVDEVIRLHGGTLHVENAPSGGARFSVRLPA